MDSFQEGLQPRLIQDKLFLNCLRHLQFSGGWFVATNGWQRMELIESVCQEARGVGQLWWWWQQKGEIKLTLPCLNCAMPVVGKLVLSSQLSTIIEHHDFHECYSTNCSYTTFMSSLSKTSIGIGHRAEQSRAVSLKGSDSYFPLWIFPSERPDFVQFKYHLAPT